LGCETFERFNLYLKLVQPRKFNDDEVGQILSKAIALQAGDSGSTASQGTSLEELMRVAAEIGIDASAIERAAVEVSSSRSVTASPDSNTVLVEQSIPGELSDEAWEELITAVRTFSGTAGKSEIGALSREWIGGGEMETLVLTGLSRSGRTQLKLLGDNSGITAFTMVKGLGAIVFGGILPLVLYNKQAFPLSAYSALFLTILIVSAAIFSTKASIRRKRGRFNVRLGVLMNQLAKIVEANQGQPVVTRLSALEIDAPQQESARS